MTPDEVKKRLKRQNISQAEFARKCGVSSAAMALFINRKMTSKRLEKRLAKLLGVTVEELRGDGGRTQADEQVTVPCPKL